MKVNGSDSNPYGRVELTPTGDFEAGSLQSFKLTYTAGSYGVDDLGGIKIIFSLACDQVPLQAEKPREAGYVNAKASNGSLVLLKYDPLGSPRPFYKTLHARVVGGGLNEGETLRLFLGGKGKRAPGIRIQTFCENDFEFKVLADVFSTNTFIPLKTLAIQITSGPPSIWCAILPTLKRPGDSFRLCLKANDKWGNPSDKINAELTISSNIHVNGLPEKIAFKTGEFTKIIDNLSVNKEGTLFIKILDQEGSILTETNPLIISRDSSYLH
ncbi:MAG: DUF3604 domain-containing protein, partial [Candidatus Hodarchaeota archaeon]